MEIQYGQLFYWSVHCLISSMCCIFNGRKQSLKNFQPQTEIWEEKCKENELNGVLKNKIGRFCPQKLTEDQWLKRKEIILDFDVDLTKLGWKSEVERKTELTRREIINTVNHFLDLQELCYKRR